MVLRNDLGGEKNYGCCGGEGALITEIGEREKKKERKEREKEERERERERREKSVHRGLHKKSTSPNPLTGKSREPDYHKFLQPWSSKSKDLKVCTITTVKPGGHSSALVKVGRGPRVDSMV